MSYNYKRRRAEAEAAGICTKCFRRPADQDGLVAKRLVRCAICRDGHKTQPERDYSAPRPFCLECLAAGFHRDDCSVMLGTISVDERIERVLQGKLARGLGPPSYDKLAPHARKELTPDTVEDGTSRDEGLGESGQGDTTFPVPPGVKLIPPSPGLRKL